MRNSAALSCLTCFTFALLATTAGGCGGSADPSASNGESVDSTSAEVSGDSEHASALRGRFLFENATFGGNGRTCGTCHTRQTGTITPQLIDELYRHDRHAPIFRPLDSDDGVGNSYTRLRTNATIRITLDLPPTIRIHDNPSQRSITVNRSTPTMINSALVPLLMWDGRENNLETQALDAVHAHAQEGFEPTARQLSDIAAFERTLFTSEKLEKYAHGGPAPKIPDGHTASEKRGRAFFEPDGLCGNCHGGPLLNTLQDNNILGLVPGTNFAPVLAGWDSGLGFPQPPDAPNPLITFDMDCTASGTFCFLAPFLGGTVSNPDDPTTGFATIAMPDPGQAITTGDNDLFSLFKIPILWGVKDTAPYFHDNSAKTLEDVMAHYDKFFQFFIGVSLSAQDQQDLVNYVKLL